MCGRYTLIADEDQILELLPGMVFGDRLVPRYNIAPTQDIAVVLNQDATRVQFAHWGLIPSWAKEKAIGNRMINARAETVHEKPSYKRPFLRQRCLILADGFYEWQAVTGEKRKQPMYIRMRGGKPFAFAGLWDRWRDPDGDEIVSATIITTTANKLLAEIHERMPVILNANEYGRWLETQEQSPDALRACLTQYDPDAMEVIPVSTKVNNARVDSPECVKPLEAA